MFGLHVNFVLFGEKFWTVSVKFLKTFPKFTAGGAVEKRMYLDELPGNTLKLVPVPRPQRTAHVCNTLRRRRGRRRARFPGSSGQLASYMCRIVIGRISSWSFENAKILCDRRLHTKCSKISRIEIFWVPEEWGRTATVDKVCWDHAFRHPHALPATNHLNSSSSSRLYCSQESSLSAILWKNLNESRHV